MKTTRTAVITGANSGIGRATAFVLAAKGYSIVTICRNAAEGKALTGELSREYPGINAENVVADLGDFDSIKGAAQAILVSYPVVDRLINNAGYYPAEIEYKDGVEKTLRASHLGHMLLTHLLIPALDRSSEGRIINVSSALHNGGSLDRMFMQPANHNAWQAYSDAKLANVLYTLALTKHLPSSITTYSLHPGVVKTGFGKNAKGMMKAIISVMGLFFLTPERGAETSVFLATADIGKIKPYNGLYFVKSMPEQTRHADVAPDRAEAFYQKSKSLLQQYLPLVVA